MRRHWNEISVLKNQYINDKKVSVCAKYAIAALILSVTTACTKTPEEMKTYLTKTPEGYSEKAYLTACEKGNQKRVKEFLHAGMSWKVQNEDGRNCLHSAISEGHTQLVELLLKSGADVNIDSEKGLSNLALALNSKRNKEKLVELLVEYKFNFSKRQEAGFAPFDLVSPDEADGVLRKLVAGMDKKKYVEKSANHHKIQDKCVTEVTRQKDQDRLKVLAKVASLVDTDPEFKTALHNEIQSCLQIKLSGIQTGDANANIGWYLALLDEFEKANIAATALSSFQNLLKQYIESKILLFTGNENIDTFLAMAAYQNNALMKDIFKRHEKLEEHVLKIRSLKSENEVATADLQKQRAAILDRISVLNERKSSLERDLADTYNVRGYVVDGLDWNNFAPLARKLANRYPTAKLYEVRVGWERILLVTVSTSFRTRGLFSMQTKKIDEVDVNTTYGTSTFKVMLELTDYYDRLNSLNQVTAQIAENRESLNKITTRTTELDAELGRAAYVMLSTHKRTQVANSVKPASENGQNEILVSQIDLFRNSMRKPVLHLAKSLTAQGFKCKKTNGTLHWVWCRADASQNRYLGFFDTSSADKKNEVAVFISSFDGIHVNHINAISPSPLNDSQIQQIKQNIKFVDEEKRIVSHNESGFKLRDNQRAINIHIRKFQDAASLKEDSENMIFDGTVVYFDEIWSSKVIPQLNNGKLDNYFGFANNLMSTFQFVRSMSEDVSFVDVRNIRKNDFERAEQFNKNELESLKGEALESFNRLKKYIAGPQILKDARTYTSSAKKNSKGIDPDVLVFPELNKAKSVVRAKH